MKNIYYKLSLIVFSLLGITSIKAQTLPLVILETGHLTVDKNGTTIDETGLASDFEIDKVLWVVNPNSQALTLKCKKTEIDMLAGTENGTCWQICPGIFDVAGANTPAFVSLGGVEMTETAGPNDTIKTFGAHYKPMNLDGCSIIKYEWYDENDLNTALASVNIRFIHSATGSCSASINEKTDYSFDIFPNPANKSINITLDDNINTNDNISLDIYDIIGKKVFSNDIKSLNNKNQISLSTVNLIQGVYLVSISSNGNTIATNRLMIEH